jgi:molybdopterin synthase sulfurtransferase
MEPNYQLISTSELTEFIKNKQGFVIDVRPVDAYNGWQLNNESRGGHLPGAKSLPAKWLNYLDWIEIVRKKSIFPENEIVVYGYDQETIEKVAERFKQSGYTKIRIYKHFLMNG